MSDLSVTLAALERSRSQLSVSSYFDDGLFRREMSTLFANRPRYGVRTIAGIPALPRVDAVSTTDGSLASRWRLQLGARVEY